MNRKCFWDKRIYCVPADVVGEVFEQLENEFGCVTPENFLDVSRPDDSPTHKLFEWDDGKAAENYRKHQSRCVINSLRIEIIADDKSFKVPAYVNVIKKEDGSAQYQNTPKVFQVTETREIVLARAKSELESFKKKYSTFKEFAKVFEAIDEVI